MGPHEYWKETPAQRRKRVERQDRDRKQLINDHTELVHSNDLDELYAELLRLHNIVDDDRTAELLMRIFPDRAVRS